MGCGICKQKDVFAVQPNVKCEEAEFDNPEVGLDLSIGEDQQAEVLVQPKQNKQRTKKIPVITATTSKEVTPENFTKADCQRAKLPPMSLDVAELSDMYGNVKVIGCVMESNRPESNQSSQPFSNFPSLPGGIISAGQSLGGTTGFERINSKKQRFTHQVFDLEVSSRSESIKKTESQRSDDCLDKLIMDLD